MNTNTNVWALFEFTAWMNISAALVNHLALSGDVDCEFIAPGWFVDDNNVLMPTERLWQLAADGWDFEFEYGNLRVIPTHEKHIRLRWIQNPAFIEFSERMPSKERNSNCDMPVDFFQYRPAGTLINEISA